jgi:hypothetical protein
MSNLLFKDRRQNFERRRFSYSYCIPERRSGEERRTETDQTTIINSTETAISQHLTQDFSWLSKQPMAMR